MGGNGASSGISAKGNKYGTQYRTVFESGDIKFVTKVKRDAESLLETKTMGRVYVEVGGEDLLRIVSFDDKKRRNHVIERDKRRGGWHTHNGYYHAENGASEHEPLSDSDKEMLAKVTAMWYKFIGK